ncbi:cytochrome P450 4c21-like isoform X2 [Manduca sexta]|uniref:cytochrome P450 4c21-like isoform X2 n=1 Tax=Manduca sexta TaxID=7130 RepID=UPI00189045AA|nr:cytochrome P450 4c21-like isoform X2 [Manduca sexta]
MLFLTLVCCICFLWVLWKRKWKTAYSLPPALSGKLPLIGHIHHFLGDTTQIFETLRKITEECDEKGGVITLSIGPMTLYGITDIDDCATIANTSYKKAFYYDFSKPLVGEGIFSADETLTCDGDGYTPLNVEYVESVQNILNILTTKFLRVWFHIPFVYYFSEHRKAELRCLKIIHDMSNRMIVKRKEKLKNMVQNNCYQNDSGKSKPLIDLMLQLADDDGLTDQEIRENIDTFLIAGFDTLSSALTCIFATLGSYPDVQNRAYEEVLEIFNDPDKDVDKNDLLKLVYVEAVIKETMRLYPMAFGVARCTDTEVKLKNYTVPAGTNCLLGFWSMHRQSIWGSDAHQFRPERWLNPDTLPKNPNAYAPFSIGKRNCIGKSYAMMSMKVLVAHVLHRYRITADVSKMKMKLDAVLKPASGYDISLENRI